MLQNIDALGIAVGTVKWPCSRFIIIVNHVRCVTAIVYSNVTLYTLHATRFLSITSLSSKEAVMLLYSDFPVHILDHLKINSSAIL